MTIAVEDWKTVMNLAYEWTTDDVQILMVIVGALVLAAICAAYWASKHRSDSQVKIAQEQTKQAELNKEKAALELETARLQAKAAAPPVEKAFDDYSR